MKKEFNPELYECPECKDVIKSAYTGQFARCNCGECFIDQTVYYTRGGGNIIPLSEAIFKQFEVYMAIDEIVDGFDNGQPAGYIDWITSNCGKKEN